MTVQSTKLAELRLKYARLQGEYHHTIMTLSNKRVDAENAKDLAERAAAYWKAQYDAKQPSPSYKVPSTDGWYWVCLPEDGYWTVACRVSYPGDAHWFEIGHQTWDDDFPEGTLWLPLTPPKDPT